MLNGVGLTESGAVDADHRFEVAFVEIVYADVGLASRPGPFQCPGVRGRGKIEINQSNNNRRGTASRTIALPWRAVGEET